MYKVIGADNEIESRRPSYVRHKSPTSVKNFSILTYLRRGYIDSSGGEFLWNQLLENLPEDTEFAKQMFTYTYILHLQQPHKLEVSRARQNLAYKKIQEALSLRSSLRMQAGIFLKR